MPSGSPSAETHVPRKLQSFVAMHHVDIAAVAAGKNEASEFFATSLMRGCAFNKRDGLVVAAREKVARNCATRPLGLQKWCIESVARKWLRGFLIVRPSA